LETKHEIDQNKIGVIGHSYGGFIATHLAIRYPNTYKSIVLTNPIVNLASMASTSSVPDWVWQMLGKNFTHSSVATDIYIDAWNR
jgi:acylaminoacyl-peptidase